MDGERQRQERVETDTQRRGGGETDRQTEKQGDRDMERQRYRETDRDGTHRERYFLNFFITRGDMEVYPRAQFDGQNTEYKSHYDSR